MLAQHCWHYCRIDSTFLFGALQCAVQCMQLMLSESLLEVNLGGGDATKSRYSYSTIFYTILLVIFIKNSSYFGAAVGSLNWKMWWCEICSQFLAIGAFFGHQCIFCTCTQCFLRLRLEFFPPTVTLEIPPHAATKCTKCCNSTQSKFSRISDFEIKLIFRQKQFISSVSNVHHMICTSVKL